MGRVHSVHRVQSNFAGCRYGEGRASISMVDSHARQSAWRSDGPRAGGRTDGRAEVMLGSDCQPRPQGPEAEAEVEAEGRLPHHRASERFPERPQTGIGNVVSGKRRALEGAEMVKPHACGNNCCYGLRTIYSWNRKRL